MHQRFGNRKPPSSAYITQSPVFYYDETEGLFIGGNFWDGRATGWTLGSPAAEQAQGPFLNPVEQNNPDAAWVLQQVALSDYAWMWELVWGEPIDYTDPFAIALNYDRLGYTIAAYEGSAEVNQFSSKYDYYLAGEVELTPMEAWGLELFEGEGMCSACHISQLGDEWVDYGLGGFLETIPEFADLAGENMGKHKVPTLRNVDKKPGNNFTKAYIHNGVFKSLKEVTRFYNTRDVETWPPPEVPENVNTDELGNLGPTDAEENAIVAFMKTLSDGYKLPKAEASSPYGQMETGKLELQGPNPVQATAIYTVTLPVPGQAELSLFTLGGQKVATIFSGLSDAGATSLELDLRDMSSGVYILYLKSGNRQVTKKITHLN
jgi:cytochrome c peroxidase